MNNQELQKIADEIQEKLVVAGIAEKDVAIIMQSLLQKTLDDIVNELLETLDGHQKEKLDALSDTPTTEEICTLLGITEEQLGKEYVIRMRIYLDNLDENTDVLVNRPHSTQ